MPTLAASRVLLPQWLLTPSWPRRKNQLCYTSLSRSPLALSLCHLSLDLAISRPVSRKRSSASAAASWGCSLACGCCFNFVDTICAALRVSSSFDKPVGGRTHSLLLQFVARFTCAYTSVRVLFDAFFFLENFEIIKQLISVSCITFLIECEYLYCKETCNWLSLSSRSQAKYSCEMHYFYFVQKGRISLQHECFFERPAYIALVGIWAFTALAHNTGRPWVCIRCAVHSSRRSRYPSKFREILLCCWFAFFRVRKPGPSVLFDGS